MFRKIIFSFIVLSLIPFISEAAFIKGAVKVQTEGDNIVASDYSNDDNWLSLPKKESKKVDIFFVYPTAWRAAEKEFPIAKIDNPLMRQTAQYYLKTRASAFETSGNIYAPYYRQLDSSFAFYAYNTLGISGAMKYYHGVPKTDIIAAFDYYIKHYNKGKPFILVGHSQGSIMLKEVLIDYMKEHPEVYERMIAAYIIGFPVTKQDYLANPHLRYAQSSDDIGVIISYNVESPVIDGINPFSTPDSILINPISWKISDEPAAASANLGSIIVAKNGSFKKAKHIADAKINPARGTIICSTVDRNLFSSHPASRGYMPLGVLHENDIPLYYYDLRKNAQDRVKAYFNKNQ